MKATQTRFDIGFQEERNLPPFGETPIVMRVLLCVPLIIALQTGYEGHRMFETIKHWHPSSYQLDVARNLRGLHVLSSYLVARNEETNGCEKRLRHFAGHRLLGGDRGDSAGDGLHPAVRCWSLEPWNLGTLEPWNFTGTRT